MKAAEDALFTDTNVPRWGARVVLWGFPGAGKDALAAAVVRSARVSQCAHATLQTWLQGSDDLLFERQLRQVDVSLRLEVVSVLPGFDRFSYCFRAPISPSTWFRCF